MSRTGDPRLPQSKIDPKILDARALCRMARLAGERPDTQLRALAEVPLRDESLGKTHAEVLREVLTLARSGKDPAVILESMELMIDQHLWPRISDRPS